MEIHGIGELILRLREERKISQEELASGLCTQKFLSKLEIGNSLPDSFLLDALMSRMGKSADKLEYVISKEDYQFFVRRIEIENELEEGNSVEAEKKLAEYEKILKDEDTIHFQYIDMIRAFLIWDNKDNISDCVTYLEKAMSRTMRFWQEENVWNYPMTWREVGLLLVWAKKVKSENELEDFFEKLLVYIDNQWNDEEEKVKIYPFAIVLYSQLLKKDGKYRKIDQLCANAIALLTRNGAISNLLVLLKIRIDALKKLESQETDKNDLELERLIKQMEALEAVEKEYGYKENTVSIFMKVKREFYLDSEVIRKNRMAQGMTQEEISEDICAQETLARIEKGRTPQNTKFQKLAEKISWTKKKQTNELGCWDYQLLEKKAEIDWLVSRCKYEEAKKRLEEFSVAETSEARQYIQYMTIMVDINLGKRNVEEALTLLKNTLEMTLPITNIANVKNYILTKQEVLILNGIGIVYAKMGQKEKAVQLYKEIMQSYKQSKILPVFQAYGMLTVMGNLASFLEEIDCFEEAILIRNQKMQLELACRRIGEAGRTLAGLAFTLERQGTEEKKRKELYVQAYHISDLVKDTVVKEITLKHFKEVYGHEI